MVSLIKLCLMLFLVIFSKNIIFSQKIFLSQNFFLLSKDQPKQKNNHIASTQGNYLLCKTHLAIFRKQIGSRY